MVDDEAACCINILSKIIKEAIYAAEESGKFSAEEVEEAEKNLKRKLRNLNIFYREEILPLLTQYTTFEEPFIKALYDKACEFIEVMEDDYETFRRKLIELVREAQVKKDPEYIVRKALALSCSKR